MVRWFVLPLLLIFCAAASTLAHHSPDSEYDRDKGKRVETMITSVNFVNPHVTFRGDVAGTDGKETWTFEISAPILMNRAGLSQAALHGRVVDLYVFPSKDGSKRAWVDTMKFEDGKIWVAPDAIQAVRSK